MSAEKTYLEFVGMRMARVLAATAFRPIMWIVMRILRTQWHRWFAWYPVNEVRMTTKWLQFVERRWDKGEKTGEAEWRYRSVELSSIHLPSKRDEPRAR